MRLTLNRLDQWLLCAALALLVVGATACRQGGGDEPAMSASTDPAREPTTSTSPGLSKVTIVQVKEWMDEGAALVLLDSRGEGSWRAATSKARGAIRVPPHDVERHIGSVPEEGTIVVYCT